MAFFFCSGAFGSDVLLLQLDLDMKCDINTEDVKWVYKSMEYRPVARVVREGVNNVWLELISDGVLESKE